MAVVPSRACRASRGVSAGATVHGAGDRNRAQPDHEDHRDLDTLRVLPYMPGLALVHCEAVQPDGTSLEIAPRRMLRTQLDRLRELGFEARVGLESEFVLCNGLQPMVQHNLDYALDHPPAL